MRKNILLAGGFHKARSLGESLLKKGYKVTVVNRDYEDCMALAENPELHVIHGDGTKTYVLEDANVDTIDIAIALTKKDEENLVICELCKKKYDVPKTVSLVNDPKKTSFFYKMGIDSVVCAITAITNILEQQAFLDEMATMIPIGEGRMSIAEVPISIMAPAAGKRIEEIQLPKDVIIGCILRGDHSVIPRGDTRILGGDVVVLISSNEKEVLAVSELTGR